MWMSNIRALMHKHKQFYIYICGHLEVQVGDEIFTCSHFEFFLHFPHSILKFQHYPVYIYIYMYIYIYLGMVFKFSNKHLPQTVQWAAEGCNSFLGFHENGRTFFADRLADVFLARLFLQSAKAFFRNREQDLQALMFQTENDHAFLRGLAFYNPI